MNKAHESIDQIKPPVEGGKRLTTWYAQGHSDGLGDRLLMFDNTSAPSWEILRFKPTLAAEANFEAALRQRVDQLTGFHHPAFPTVKPITELGQEQEDGLAVVSTYASGVSLSEGLKKPRSAGFAVRLLRQVVPALAALQQHAPGLSHGALTIDRVVLTGEGRLMIREHMLGSALATLGRSSSRLWVEFGILTPPAETPAPALDARSDVTQLALMVISLMRGRRIGPDDYPARLGGVLDELADRTLWHEPERFRLLRGWLERALQMGDRPFESARDANAALAEIQDEPERTADQTKIHLATKRPIVPDTPPPTPAPGPPLVTLLAPDFGRQAVPTENWLHTLRRDPRVIRWAAAAVAVLAIGEAAFIGRLMFSGSESKASAATAAAPTVQPRATTSPDEPRLTPLQLEVAPRTLPASAIPTPSVAGATTAVAPKPVDANAFPAPSVRSGGFRIASPVEIHVLDGERVLGSSAEGPIITTAGRHELDFVNSAIGYRARRVVDVRAGQIVSLSVTIPNGSLNINATPWANVWIDGNPYGETPLGNVSLPPGEHEVVFRNPQFGERRERATVRADTPTRVTVAFK